jgi:hypothetical protein
MQDLRSVLSQLFLQYLYQVYMGLFSVCRGDSLWETKLHWPRSCRSNVEESDTKWSVRKLLRLEREREREGGRENAGLNIHLLQEPDEIIRWNLSDL